MQTGFFHSQQMMVTPYKEGPVLTGRNNVASAFFFFLVFGQLFLLPVPSELMQIIHSLISKFRFSRIPKFQNNKRGMTSSVPFELSCRQAGSQACYWAGRLWQGGAFLKTVPSSMSKARGLPPPPPAEDQSLGAVKLAVFGDLCFCCKFSVLNPCALVIGLLSWCSVNTSSFFLVL